MQKKIAKGQTSVGILVTFIELFLVEPEDTPKKHIYSTLGWLTDIAKSFFFYESLDQERKLARSTKSSVSKGKLEVK